MPIQSYGGFMRMTGFCKTKVPQEILDTLEPIKDNVDAVKAYGIHLGTQMCKQLIDAGTPGLHMYVPSPPLFPGLSRPIFPIANLSLRLPLSYSVKEVKRPEDCR